MNSLKSSLRNSLIRESSAKQTPNKSQQIIALRTKSQYQKNRKKNSVRFSANLEKNYDQEQKKSLRNSQTSLETLLKINKDLNDPHDLYRIQEDGSSQRQSIDHTSLLRQRFTKKSHMDIDTRGSIFSNDNTNIESRRISHIQTLVKHNRVYQISVSAENLHYFIMNFPNHYVQIDNYLMTNYHHYIQNDKISIICAILQQSIKHRTYYQIQKLKEFFTGNLTNLFEKNEDLQDYIFKHMEYQSLKKTETLFHYKEPGNRLYSILRGRVYILCFIKLQESQFKQLIQEFSVDLPYHFRYASDEDQNVYKRICDKSIMDLIKNDEKERDIVFDLLEKNKKFRLIKMMKPFEIFGEMCYRENGFRNATVVCQTDCEFATLKNNVSKDAQQSMQQQFSHELEFLLTVSLFQDCLIQEIKIVQSYLTEVHLKKNQKLFNQNEQNVYFYIIKQGQIELQEQQEQSCQYNHKSSIFDSFMSSKINYKQNQSSIKSKFKTNSLCILGAGQTCGEELLFQNKYLYNAVVKSFDVVLLKISKHEIINNLQNDQILINVQKQLQQKKVYHNKLKENFEKDLQQMSSSVGHQQQQISQNLQRLSRSSSLNFSESLKHQISTTSSVMKLQKEQQQQNQPKFENILQIAQACNYLQTQSKNLQIKNPKYQKVLNQKELKDMIVRNQEQQIINQNFKKTKINYLKPQAQDSKKIYYNLMSKERLKRSKSSKL